MKVSLIGSTGMEKGMDVEKVTVSTTFGIVEVDRIIDGYMEYYVVRRNNTDANIPPHALTKGYIEALKALGVTHAIASCAVGALNSDIKIGDYVVLDQFMGFFQKHITYYEDNHFAFVDMTYPFCENLRKCLVNACRIMGGNYFERGCYLGMDGPRYETAAEIRAMQLLGGDVVGMTVVREAIMMREAGICYGTVCLVTNMGAGMESTDSIHNNVLFDIRKESGETTKKILKEAVRQFYAMKSDLKLCHCTDTSNDFQ